MCLHRLGVHKREIDIMPYPRCSICNTSQFIIIDVDNNWYCFKCKNIVVR